MRGFLRYGRFATQRDNSSSVHTEYEPWALVTWRFRIISAGTFVRIPTSCQVQPLVGTVYRAKKNQAINSMAKQDLG